MTNSFPPSLHEEKLNKTCYLPWEFDSESVVLVLSSNFADILPGNHSRQHGIDKEETVKRQTSEYISEQIPVPPNSVFFRLSVSLQLAPCKHFLKK